MLTIVACSPKPPGAERPPAATAATLTDREWVLVGLGELDGPLGAGGRPATIRFDPATGRAEGFAGCNRYSAAYTLTGDSLAFGPAISTKMACVDGTSWSGGTSPCCRRSGAMSCPTRPSPSMARADRWHASVPPDTGVPVELESERATT